MITSTTKRDIDSMKLKKPELYDLEKLKLKWQAVPDYVVEARSKSEGDPMYDKIVLDKWGRKSGMSNAYVEVPEMVFYRAALTVANGMKTHNPDLNLEYVTKDIFERFSRREIFPNTPYMANAGHKDVAIIYQTKIVEDYGLDSKILESLNEISELQSKSNIVKGKKKLIEQKLDLISSNINVAITDPIQAKTLYETLLDLEEEKKQSSQLFACFVLPIYDSKKSIFDTQSDAADIQKKVGGTGFNFSNLRPANEIIRESNGITDGPISFMAMYSTVLGKTMNQGGKREGANMFMLDYNHPDIMRFIYSKSKDGEIPAANISIAIDHPFMQAVMAESEEEHFYPLVNPHYNPEIRPDVPKHYTKNQLEKAIHSKSINAKAKLSLMIDKDGETVLSPYMANINDNNGKPVFTEEDQKIGKVVNGIVYLDSRKIMKHLAVGSWWNGEPGVIFTGTINDYNPTHTRHYVDFLHVKNPERTLDSILEEVSELNEEGKPVNLPIGVGEIRATNPCGEKPLLPYESCVLGHINLEQLLDKDSNSPSGYSINRTRLKENTRLMYETLDNAIDQNEFTHLMIEKTQKSNRKIGLGFMGLANMLMKLEIPYDSEEGRKLAEEIWEQVEGYSDELSHEKGESVGAFPNFEISSLRFGRRKRNAIVRTIAPTGTTGFVAKTTGGLEPEYALTYTRTTVQGTQIKLFNPVLDEKLEKYSIFYNDEERAQFIDFISEPSKGSGSLQEWELKRNDDESEELFTKRKSNFDKIKNFVKTTYDISPKDHLLMEAVIQQHTDDAISKTTNFRSNATVNDIYNAFIDAYKLGIKGVTFYRDGARKDQPLEVKGKDTKLEELVVSPEPRRPNYVVGTTEKFSTPYDRAGFLTVNIDPSTGKPYEAFINIGKAGEDITAMSEGFGRITSLAFQLGATEDQIIEQLEGIGGTSQTGIGPTKVISLPDAIAKAMGRIIEKREKYGSVETKPQNGNGTKKKTQSGNFCSTCGKPMIMLEGCEKCSNSECGFSRC